MADPFTELSDAISKFIVHVEQNGVAVKDGDSATWDATEHVKGLAAEWLRMVDYYGTRAVQRPAITTEPNDRPWEQ
jgi:hypothetical protein